MPDTFSNPYTVDTPLGAALKNLGSVITKSPSEASNILHAEQALKIRRENENRSALGDTFQQYGTPGFDRGYAMNTAIRAGVNPNDLGGYERYGAANTYGASDPRTTNAFVGAGGSYGSTYGGVQDTLANAIKRTAMQVGEQRYQFDNTPQVVDTPEGPQYVRRTESYGMPAAEGLDKVKGSLARRAVNTPEGIAGMNPVEQRFVGAEGKSNPTPHNYVFNGQNLITYDGINDARTGQPLPVGGHLANATGGANDVGLRPNVQGDIQKSNIALERLRGLTNYTRSLVEGPGAQNNVGLPGTIKGLVQDANAVAGSVATGLGYKGMADALEATRQRALASGVSPGLLSGVFDPKLPQTHQAYDLMVFSAAEALAGQSGRNVSDKDVKAMRAFVGDPREFTANPQRLLANLDGLNHILGLNQQVNDKQLRGSGTSVPAAPAAPGASPPPAPAPGAPQPQERWERGPDGRLRRVQ